MYSDAITFASSVLESHALSDANRNPIVPAKTTTTTPTNNNTTPQTSSPSSAQSHSSATGKSNKDKFEDCTSCRVLGAGTFTALGVYTYVSGHSQIRRQLATQTPDLVAMSKLGLRSRQVGVTAIATGLVAVGAWRAVS